MADTRYIDRGAARFLVEDHARRLLEISDRFFAETLQAVEAGEPPFNACQASAIRAQCEIADRTREFELALSLASEQTERRYLDGAPSQ